MTSVNPSRSQAILRVPVDIVEAVLILQDGERADVMLFVPPREDLARFVCEGPAFMPVLRAGRELFVARSAIAAFGLPARRAPQLDDGLPIEEQPVGITLRSGATLEGVLRWISLDGLRRTSDGLNADGAYLVLAVGPMTYLVMKTHVATVVEL